jgi:hypothetical protein
MPQIRDLTHSPLGLFVDTAASKLQLYQYGRKPFIFFVIGIATTLCILHVILSLPGIGGTNPSKPEWKASLSELHTQISDIYSKLIYAGAFVLGVSQAVKKKSDIQNPDLTYVYLYGKLIIFLLLIEFGCNLMLQPTSSGKSMIKLSEKSTIGALLSWLRNMSGNTARQLGAGVTAGFGYGYMIRGVGVLFEKY